MLKRKYSGAMADKRYPRGWRGREGQDGKIALNQAVRLDKMRKWNTICKQEHHG
jgi:hypothetical protein